VDKSRRNEAVMTKYSDGSPEVADAVPIAPPAGPSRFAAFLRCACDGARLMVGMPNYDTYVAHMSRTHPGRAIMTYAEFFRERQNARYGGQGSGLRCC